jgi:hypothetical protein
MRTFVAAAVVALALTVVGSPAQAASTLQVPSQYPTIQAAIDAATEGDTVLVAPGTYAERIDFLLKDIVLASEGGPSVTTIDGGGLGTVVEMDAEASETPTLHGFTIRGGGGSDGGGVRSREGPALIEGNWLVDNSYCGEGGGIAVDFSAATIRDNVISRNRQVGCTGGIGGAGVSIGGAGTVTLVDNVITDNIHGSSGGGVTLFAAGTPTIARNVISGNRAGGQGGGMWIVNRSDAQIENNVIVSNTAQEGAGVYWLVPSGARGPVLVNNTIADNTASVTGSALFVDGFDVGARVANNILRGGGAAVLHCGSLNDPNAPAIEFNDVVHVSGGARYAGICADRTGTNGNVSVDPGFVSAAAGDYHLSSSSALVDLGTNAGVPATDLDGELRTFDGDEDGVPETDIGADEVLSVGDTTPPILQVPSGIVVDATSPQGAVVTYSVTATDNADPDPAVACSPASGSIFAIGSTVVSCTATDDTGNSAAATFTVMVRGAAEQLAALRGEVALLPDEKVGRSLGGKLRDASNALAAGQKSKACSRLAAFIAEVQVHAGMKIPAATASKWVADANRIRAVIGC